MRAHLLLGLGLLAAAQGVAWGILAPARAAASPVATAGVEAVTPGELTGTLLLGGFRGLACDLLWMRADGAKQAGRFYESVALFEAISRIQPRFEQPWQFMAWDLAYNLSHEVQERQAKWAWVVAGIRTAVRGCERNPQSERLLRHLAWIFHHKGDLFHDEIEAATWAGLLNPVIERINRQVDAAHQVALLPAGPGASNFTVALTLNRACIALADGRPGGQLKYQFLRRMVPLGIESDGNILRNKSRHLAALRRYLEALREWQVVQAWAEVEKADDPERHQRQVAKTSIAMNEGRLRRKAASLAAALAPTGASETVQAAIMARDWTTLDRQLAQPGWLEVRREGRIRWLDE